MLLNMTSFGASGDIFLSPVYAELPFRKAVTTLTISNQKLTLLPTVKGNFPMEKFLLNAISYHESIRKKILSAP